jgi:hypothetical protein
VTDGDDRVNAKEGLDEEAATTIAALAIATRTPLGMRRVVIGFGFLQAAQRNWKDSGVIRNALSLGLVAYFIKRIVKDCEKFDANISTLTLGPSVTTGKTAHERPSWTTDHGSRTSS